METMLKNDKPTQMKSLSKVALAVYLLVLLWLVLFKFSFDITFILEEHQMRSINMIPFTGHLREMADNLLVFIPFGLLLGVNFKRIAFWQKLIVVLFFSITIEVVQFILAIGVTDITDVIMNTFGGLFGLTLYAFRRKHANSEKLDHFISVVGLLLIVLFLTLRIFVFRVKY
jgi:glycopeptide antibiotics resistance protein